MRLRTFVISAALLATAVASGAMVSAQPADERVDRRRAVGDWLIEYVAESDGGLVVRMSRDGDGYRLKYHEAFWRGNYGPVRDISTERRDCGGGGEESGAGADPTLEAGELRRRFTDQLADCGAGEPEIAAALEDLEQAFEIASGWAAEAAATTAAEAAAIAAYGEDMSADTNVANGVEPESGRR